MKKIHILFMLPLMLLCKGTLGRGVVMQMPELIEVEIQNIAHGKIETFMYACELVGINKWAWVQVEIMSSSYYKLETRAGAYA